MAIKFVIGEYRVLWEALTRYQSDLERLAVETSDEDDRLLVDDKLQKIDDMLRMISGAAKQDWDIELP